MFYCLGLSGGRNVCSPPPPAIWVPTCNLAICHEHNSRRPQSSWGMAYCLLKRERYASFIKSNVAMLWKHKVDAIVLAYILWPIHLTKIPSEASPFPSDWNETEAASGCWQETDLLHHAGGTPQLSAHCSAKKLPHSHTYFYFISFQVCIQREFS